MYAIIVRSSDYGLDMDFLYRGLVMPKCKWITVLISMTLAALILSSCAVKEVSQNIGSESTAADNVIEPLSTPAVQAPSSVTGKASAAAEKLQSAVDLTVPIIIQDMSPEGWTVLESGGGKAIREGDLNKDGNNDLAFVIEGTGANGESAPRTLIVAFGPEYSLKVEAGNAILKADEGGIMGDPFDGIEIKNSSLYLHFFGGSSWRWDYSYQFRFQDEDFYLIGATKSFFSINTNEGTKEDYNLLTGDYIITETSEDGNDKVTKGNYDKRNKYRLKDFNVRNEDIFEIPSK